jgi:hypothetical protein
MGVALDYIRDDINSVAMGDTAVFRAAVRIGSQKKRLEQRINDS